MNLALTPDQTMMREEAARFLAERSSSAAVRAIADADGLRDDALWAAIAGDLGWCGVAIPERFGGLGLGAFELSLLMEQSGQRLACAPFFATAGCAAPLLLHAADEPVQLHFLPMIAAGQCAATVIWPSVANPGALDRAPLTATRDGAGYRLSGSAAHVIDLAGADLVFAIARLAEGEVGLFAMTGKIGWSAERLRTLDATRSLSRLDVHGAPAERIDHPGRFAQGYRVALDWATLALAADQLGAAQGSLDMTLAYIGERVQFGRRIASFQAVKHRCAKIAVEIEVARALLLGAAAGLDGGTDAQQVSLDVSVAKVAATEALTLSADEAIQLHGGVGFTWEYDPHLYYKRAQASAAWFGSREHHLDQIADHLLGGSAND